MAMVCVMSKRRIRLIEAIGKVNDAIKCTDLNGDYQAMIDAKALLKRALKAAERGDMAEEAHQRAIQQRRDEIARAYNAAFGLPDKG